MRNRKFYLSYLSSTHRDNNKIRFLSRATSFVLSAADACLSEPCQSRSSVFAQAWAPSRATGIRHLDGNWHLAAYL